jgi:hypothetical protein
LNDGGRKSHGFQQRASYTIEIVGPRLGTPSKRCRFFPYEGAQPLGINQPIVRDFFKRDHRFLLLVIGAYHGTVLRFFYDTHDTTTASD